MGLNYRWDVASAAQKDKIIRNIYLARKSYIKDFIVVVEKVFLFFLYGGGGMEFMYNLNCF